MFILLKFQEVKPEELELKDTDSFRHLKLSFFRPDQFARRNFVIEVIIAFIAVLVIGSIPLCLPNAEDFSPILGILAFCIIFWKLSNSQSRDSEVDSKTIESRKFLKESFDSWHLEENTDKAIVALNQAIGVNPEYLWATVERALFYIEIGNISKAIEDCTRVIKLNSLNAASYLLRAVAYVEEQEYAQALKDCITATIVLTINSNQNLRRDDISFFKKCVNENLQQQRKLEAELNKLLKAISKIDSSNSLQYLKRYQTTSDAESHKLKIKENTRYIHQTEGENHLPVIHYEYRARSFMALEEYQKAIDDYSKILSQEPDSKHILTLKEIAEKALKKLSTPSNCTNCDTKEDYYQTNIDESKRKIFKLSNEIAASPLNAYAFYRRGEAYFFSKEFAKAIEDFNNTIALGARSYLVYEYRGYCYLNQEMYHEAIKDFSQSMVRGKTETLNGYTALLYKLRGDAYYSKRIYELALKDYLTAMILSKEVRICDSINHPLVHLETIALGPRKELWKTRSPYQIRKYFADGSIHLDIANAILSSEKAKSDKAELVKPQ